MARSYAGSRDSGVTSAKCSRRECEKSRTRRRPRRAPQAPGRHTDTTAIASPGPTHQPDQPVLTLERWELVAEAGGQALLRVTGRWQPAPPPHVELVLCSADGIDAVTPLPPGPALAGDGSWSVAFAVDAGAAVRDRMVLWAGAGGGVALPAPSRPATPLVAELQEGQAVERARREIADLREQLAEAREQCAEARKQGAEAAEPDRGAEASEPDRPAAHRRLRRAPKISPAQHRDALAQLDAARTERGELEDEAARLADEKRQLEHELTQVANVEADLRHLLAARERELTQLRSELREQHARYATVAAGAPETSRDPERAATEREPEAKAERPWTGADQELLDRLARAKALAGE